jgi:hypothetical protein
MALTYTWAITSLKKTTDIALDIDNVVVQSTWTCTGTDEDGDSGTFSGATPFPLSTVDPATFIPYEDLTEADVLGWIQAVVVGSYKDHVDAQINKQIALEKDPVVDVPNGDFPWEEPTPTPTPPTPPVSAAPEGEE